MTWMTLGVDLLYSSSYTWKEILDILIFLLVLIWLSPLSLLPRCFHMFSPETGPSAPENLGFGVARGPTSRATWWLWDANGSVFWSGENATWSVRDGPFGH